MRCLNCSHCECGHCYTYATETHTVFAVHVKFSSTTDWFEELNDRRKHERIQR